MNARRLCLALLILPPAAGLTGCLKGTTELACAEIRNDTVAVHADSVVTSTGLVYRDLVVGSGARVESGSDCRRVEVSYELSLQDGTFLERSPPGSTYRVVVGVGGTIRGFEQGIVGMRVGGSRQLIIPPSLGYASQPVRNNEGDIIIPPNSTLVLDVTLESMADQ